MAGTASTMEHAEVVVVGSGFGGSVTAARLAAGNLGVIVLERGRHYPPGSFPRSPHGLANNVWDPGTQHLGLFDLWSFAGIDALVSSGVGGGSLIYANVLLRMEPTWFRTTFPDGTEQHWPVTRRDLDPFYDLAEAMLGAQLYPMDQPEYAQVPKVRAFHDAATACGLTAQPLKLAVTFANPGQPAGRNQAITDGRNPADNRRTCRMCGECDIGCNDGAKNTLDHNYLADAVRDGAEIRELCEVIQLEVTAQGRFVVTYLDRRAGPDRSPVHRSISAERLVLAAGTLGTTYLLLRNRAAFGPLSPALGTRFSGNGDLLGFLGRARTRQAGRWRPTNLDAAQGPVITSAIRIPDRSEGGTGQGFLIEDGGNPDFVNWAAGVLPLPATLRRVAHVARRVTVAKLLGSSRSRYGGELAALVDRYASSSMPLLGMGRDTPDGIMRLERDDLAIDWSTKTSRPYFDDVEEVMRRLARATGGKLRLNPLSMLQRVITVHPLGGCPMGEHPADGVVDSFGRVFGHERFSIADGSMLPGPTGANPALTIAALAERAAAEVLSS